MKTLPNVFTTVKDLLEQKGSLSLKPLHHAPVNAHLNRRLIQTLLYTFPSTSPVQKSVVLDEKQLLTR